MRTGGGIKKGWSQCEWDESRDKELGGALGGKAELEAKCLVAGEGPQVSVLQGVGGCVVVVVPVPITAPKCCPGVVVDGSRKHPIRVRGFDLRFRHTAISTEPPTTHVFYTLSMFALKKY